MSEPFALKVVDKRGQPKPERAKTPPPDLVTDIQATDDPLVYVAVLPGNRVPEQRFKVSRLEARGFNLLARRVKGLGPDGQKAIHAARTRVLRVIEKAVRVHEEADPAKQPEAEGVH